jgi:hypothetical protein
MGKYCLIKRYKEVNARGEIIRVDRKKPIYLHPCASDHIELAEYEAAGELKSSREQGEMDTWINVVETNGGLIVYSVGYLDDTPR